MRIIPSIEDAIDTVGQELGVSEWIVVDQDRINALPTRPVTISGSMSSRSGPGPKVLMAQPLPTVS